MPLGKTTTFRFDGGNWGELRALVAAADAAGIKDDEAVDLAWEGDGQRDEYRVVGLEVFERLG